MKKYLRETEVAGMLLLAIGVVIALIWGYGYGAWPCGIGMLLLLVPWSRAVRQSARKGLTAALTLALAGLLFYPCAVLWSALWDGAAQLLGTLLEWLLW